MAATKGGKAGKGGKPAASGKSGRPGGAGPGGASGRGGAADAASATVGQVSFGPATATATVERVPPRLKERYAGEIAPALREEFGYPNVMQVPGLTKIVVNMGVGDAA